MVPSDAAVMRTIRCARSPTATTWLVLAFAMVLASTAFGQTDIRIEKAGNNQDIVITINGTPVFAVYRSTSADFSVDPQLIAQGLAGSPYTDSGALTGQQDLLYYDVAGAGETSIGQSAGGDPQPEVRLTLLTPNAGKDGDSITITGTGFAQFYTANLVTFNGRPATVTATGSGTITVTVPAGSTTGPVQVRVGRNLSNTLPFINAPATGFLNLTGINVNPANSHAFVIDTGQSFTSSLIELDPFTSWSQTIRGGATNIRGFPYGPLGNKFYYGNASKSLSNAGQVRYWDLGTNTQGAYSNTAGVASSDPVSCVAVGFPLGNNNYFFFADRRNGQIRRVGTTSGRSTYEAGFTFPDSDYDPVNFAGYAGLAFDSNGTAGTNDYGHLYVSSGGTAIERVHQNNPLGAPDDTTTTTVASGFTNTAGLFMDHFLGPAAYQTRTLFITDRGAGRVSLFHAPSATLETTPRLTGLNQPRMATIGQTNTSPPEIRTYIAEPTRVVVAEDLRVHMTPTENIRAIISNCPAGVNVTPGCVGTPFPTSYQSQDRQVVVTAYVHPPRAGVDIYFDVEDPADPSPYRSGSAGDNDDTVYPGTVASGSIAIPTDSTGKASTLLTITDHVAGDNYRVRARLSNGGPVVAKTGVITAWKRIFVEMDKMFRQPGELLTSSTAAGATTIYVGNTSRFQVGDTVWVFDADNDDPDERSVTGKTANSLDLSGGVGVHLTTDSAYVGRVADGFYAPDLSYAYAAYDDAFVEAVARSHGSGPIPYTPETLLSNVTERSNFSALWFKNGKALKDDTNYVHMMGVESFLFGGTNDHYGLSLESLNWIYVSVGWIEGCCGYTADELRNAIRNTGSHEIGHHFGRSDESLGNPAWCNPSGLCAGELCLMDIATSTSLGIDEYETADLYTSANSIRKISAIP